MKKLLLAIVVLFVAGFIIGTERLPVRNWLLGELEGFALRHPDKLPLRTIGTYLFNEHCAGCHDDPAMHAPTREALSQNSRENLMIAMEFGKMQPMAAHLSKRQRGLIAYALAGHDENRYQWIAATRCSQTVDNDRRALVSNWGLGLENRRFVSSTDAGISRTNVTSLQLAWSVAFPGVTDMRSQPVLLGDTLYLGDKAGKLYALDRRSGCVRNHTQVLTGVRSAITLAELSDGRRLLIFANSLATVFAVDPVTMEIVWQRPVKVSDYSVITGSISYHNDRLYVPISSYEAAAAGSPVHACCTSHGAVTALHAATGEPIWTWHATAEAHAQSRDADSETDILGPSGAAVWTTPAVDVKRNRIYFGTAENLSHPATDTSDAVIALDMDSGKLVWKFQAIKDDVWNSACLRDGPNCPKNAGPDFDFGASVIIADLPNGEQLLLAGQKSGEIFALDPDPAGRQGKILWRQRISQGTTNGGIHWGMALSGTSLFVPVADPERDTPGYIPRPGLSSLDIRSGNILWQQPVERGCEFDYRNKPLVGLENTRRASRPTAEPSSPCSFYYGLSAAATATPELVFSAGLDGKIRAYQSDSGEILWQTETAISFDTDNGVDGHGGAIDVAGQVLAGGWLYVLSGYSMFGQLPGNVLLAYRVTPDEGSPD
jgi:polyvinyl alcohol dehydrogenase (cytochrome)